MPVGQRAIAVRVDQISGVGTVIKTGDYVDAIVGLTEEQFLSIKASVSPDEATITAPGPKGATTKVLLQGMQVLGSLLPPVAPPAEAAPAASGAPTPPPGTTTLNEQQEIVILSVTAQQAEVIRYAQLQANPLLTLSLILRSPDDFIDPATGQPLTPAAAETTGVTLKILLDQYGVLPPVIEGPVLPNNRLPTPVRPVNQQSQRCPAPRGRAPQPLDRRPDIPRLGTEGTTQTEMADQIRVLVVDDIPETRDHLTKLLGFESDIDVVGAAASGREALEMAARLIPDVVLMDINMPDMDGIAATEQLASVVPGAAVVMMSVQGEADYLRRSMLAGAREFLVKPFSSDELTASIRQVSARERDKQSRIAVTTMATAGVATNGTRSGDPGEPGSIVAVFSPKGGVGRTTVAVNLAVAAATELGKKVVIMDGSFQFGDVGVLLNLNPKSKSIADLIPELEAGELESIDTFLINHTAGIRVLLAPPSPETAEMITAGGVKKVLERLRADHDLVVVDCTSYFNDTTLAILDAADVILTMLSLEITSIKNMRLFLEVAEQLGYEKGKVRLVLNRADSALGIRVADVEHSIGRKVDETVVSDGRSVVYALNRGVPFFLSNREAQVSQDILRLARSVVGGQSQTDTVDAGKSTQKKSLFAWR